MADIIYVKGDIAKYFEYGGKFFCLGKDMKPLDYYLAIYNSRLAGEVIFEVRKDAGKNSPESFIFRLQSSLEGKGVARTLVGMVEEEAKIKGIDLIKLNSTNHGFWKHFGYEIDNENFTSSEAWKNLKSC